MRILTCVSIAVLLVRFLFFFRHPHRGIQYTSRLSSASSIPRVLRFLLFEFILVRFEMRHKSPSALVILYPCFALSLYYMSINATVRTTYPLVILYEICPAAWIVHGIW